VTQFSQLSYYQRRVLAKSITALFLAPPSQSFSEASLVRVRLDSSVFISSRLTNSENVIEDGEETGAKIAMNASRF
jgi:hypothetical protein